MSMGSGRGRGRGRGGGQMRSPGAAAGAAAWQGMRTKGQKKLVKGFAAKPRDASAPAGGRPQARKDPGEQPQGKRQGKRPAVAARKAKAGKKG